MAGTAFNEEGCLLNQQITLVVWPRNDTAIERVLTSIQELFACSFAVKHADLRSASSVIYGLTNDFPVY